MSSVSQLVSRLQDTHFPSDVDKLYAQLGHLDSLSAVPDTLMLDDDLHSTAVNMGFTAADMPIAIDGILRGHSVSKNWKTGPLFQFNLDDEASMKATAESARAFFENATLSKEKHPIVAQIETYTKKPRKGTPATGETTRGHVSLAIVNPESREPEDGWIPYDVEIFDPHGHNWGQGFAGPAYRVLGGTLSSMRTSDVPLQGTLGNLHKCDYGMCAYLNGTVLDRAIQNVSAGKPLSMQTAARNVLDMVRKDPERAKKLDYWMMGSMAKASGQTTRKTLRLQQGKQARLTRQRGSASCVERFLHSQKGGKR